MRTKEEKKEDRAWKLAWRIARYFEDLDPYDFRDNLATGESVEEGIERTAADAYRLMRDGQWEFLAENVLERIADDESGDPLAKEGRAIAKEIEAVRKASENGRKKQRRGA
jgi:hypothetical protein